MSLDLDAVGWDTAPVVHQWTADDAALYALAVGAGAEDPRRELAFTTEDAIAEPQRVLPTFPVLFETGGLFAVRDVDPTRILHAEQSITLHAPLPVEGRVTATSRVTGIFDKGSGALIRTECIVAGPDRVPVATLQSGVFVVGGGGFGGPRGATAAWSRPQRNADDVVHQQTSPQQALVYRLCGDRNPLHADPAAATNAGFPAPILHGLCTFGVVGRALLAQYCDGDPTRFGSMSARFASPVLPGDTLRTSTWREGDVVLFQTRTTDDAVVLDRGEFREAVNT